MFIHKLIFFFALIVLGSKAIAQTPYDDPQHFYLETEDKFNFFNYNLWGSKLPNNKWGLETFDSSKVYVSNGILTLECEKVGESFISGGIETVNTRAFSYGYFEIESKLPSSGTRGPWGGFWLHTGEGLWNEIDILEPNGCDSEKGTQFNSGVHASKDGIRYHSNGVYKTQVDLSENFNKYSLVWTPEYIQVLFNNEFLYEVVNPNYVSSNPMYAFLTFQIDKWGCAPNKSRFPTKYWQFKNFRYFKLKTDCLVGIAESNFDFANHDYYVQKFYSLSNSSIPADSRIVLRATDYVELNGEFSVPLGSTLTIITHGKICPE